VSLGPEMHIAIDTMGGEGGVNLTVPAALQALEKFPELLLTLVGDENQIGPLLPRQSLTSRYRLSVLNTPDAISDGQKPGNVLRSGKNSSMYLAVELLKKGKVQAMVSAGNTGALLMIGRHLVKTISGIEKPAIVATIPGAPQQSYLLDVGANLECTADQLFQFAVMGSLLAETLINSKARVGLLNIGAETHKGRDEVRRAAEMLNNFAAVNYIGFIEPDNLFEGIADVVVCDGFIGNVTIKSSAGVANVVKRFLEKQLEISSHPEVMKNFEAQINPQQFNGASLLGLRGSIIKSHGNATVEGFAYAIRQAMREVENAIPELIAKKVAAII